MAIAVVEMPNKRNGFKGLMGSLRAQRVKHARAVSLKGLNIGQLSRFGEALFAALWPLRDVPYRTKALRAL